MAYITAQQISNLTASYSAFLKAGTSYGAALREVAANLKGKACPELLEALAKVHAKHWGTSYTWTKTGNAVFFNGEESTRDTKHGTACQSWNRNVAVHFQNPARDTNVSHKADPVDSLTKLIERRLEGMTRAERNRALAAIAALV